MKYKLILIKIDRRSTEAASVQIFSRITAATSRCAWLARSFKEFCANDGLIILVEGDKETEHHREETQRWNTSCAVDRDVVFPSEKLNWRQPGIPFKSALAG